MKKPVRRKKRVYPSCTGRPADKKEAMPKKWRGPSHSEEPTAEEIALSNDVDALKQIIARFMWGWACSSKIDERE